MLCFYSLIFIGLTAHYGVAQNTVDLASIQSRSFTGKQVCDCESFSSRILALKGEKGERGQKGENSRMSAANAVFQRQMPDIVKAYIKANVKKGLPGQQGPQGSPGQSLVGTKGQKGEAANCQIKNECRNSLPLNFSDRKPFVVENRFDNVRRAVTVLRGYTEIRSLFIVLGSLATSYEEEVFFYSSKFNGLRKLNMTRVKSRKN